GAARGCANPGRRPPGPASGFAPAPYAVVFSVLHRATGATGMRRHWTSLFLLATTAALLLAACSSGPVRRVSEPSASIQQLTVRADGSWSVDLRLQNY